MMIKAIFDATGALVCYGPDEDNYAPASLASTGI